MSKDTKIPKEVTAYEKILTKDYEESGYCSHCHLKLCIDGSCGNLFCNGGK